MREVLSIEEINERHPNEFVLIDRPELDDSFEVIRGCVVDHGKSREEMYRAAVSLP